MTVRYDVVVVGGGPAGAALGTLLARSGHRVALFERRPFPRFHVGESLIPAVNLTLEKLGVRDRMDGRRFPRKHAVQFFTPRGASRPFYFAELDDPRLHHTWQVLRSDFDAMLLDHAAQSGVEVSTETEVVGVIEDDGAVGGVRINGPDGGEEAVAARVVADASGQRGLIARRFGGHDHVDSLSNAAVFAHFTGARLDPGMDAGSTLIFRLDARRWLWWIPLPDAVSVGLVATARDIWSMGGTPGEVLDTAIAASAPLSERLAHARRATEVHAVRDYTYRAHRDGGAGWLLVGDALGFIDPMYSTGLFLSMLSAELAAGAITRSLAGSGPPDLQGFAGEYQTAFERLLVMVRAFYSEDFHFGAFAKDAARRRGLIDLLSGLVRTPHAEAVTIALAEQI